MELSKLAHHVKAGEVEEIHLTAMEGGSFVINALIGGKSHPLINAKGTTLHVASVEEARKSLKGVPQVPLFLIQPAVQDEMVGLDNTGRQLNREPIPWHSSL